MKNLVLKSLVQRLHLSLLLSGFAMLACTAMVTNAGAQTATRPRIAGEINGSQLTQLPNSKNPRAAAQFDTGRLAGSTRLQGMSLYFSRTPSQEAAVQALMVAQQTPGSPQYHQWLTPEQFGARFGLADADLAKVQSWLEQQGFQVDSVARGKDMIRFSGTAAQAEAAFATEIHTYSVKTPTAAVEKHFAPSTNLSIPTALAGVVQAVHNLDDFRPKPHLVKRMFEKPKPAFSGGSDDSIFFAPGDIATQYDILKEYNAGNTGAGQSIAVVGQSEVLTSDIEAFQTASGLPVKDPTLLQVPNTGTAVFSAGDESESDLDLEWSGAIAKGASITLVYTGNSSNNGAFDALVYAIDNKVANIISSSYGACEADLGGFSLETSFTKAATLGETVVSASGDSGSTDCYGDTDQTTAQQEALGVDYPGSSPYVTSVGGTEISQANTAYETQGSAYWEAASGNSDIVTSLLQPVPEQAWNEDTTCVQYVNEGGFPLCSGGGGSSSLFTKPAYQTALTATDGQRDVPDIALNAAIYNPGYLYCSSDTSGYQQGQESSCTSGFRDSSSGYETAAGGTSFAAPIFAGMLAIINQQQGYTTGYGPVNSELYALAVSHPTGFNDITTGSNACDSSGYCSSAGESGYSAKAGYDLATGLGTIDLYNLAAAWPASSGTTLAATTTTVSASNTAPTVNTTDTFTITVTAQTSGGAVPTGTASVTVDSGTPSSVTLTTSGSAAVATYSTSFTTAGTHTVLVTYSGDTTYAASTGSASVNVVGSSSGSGNFKISSSPSTLTVAQGSSGVETITVTPAGGYTGTVDLSFDTSNDNALTNLCYSFTNATSSGDGTVVITGTTAVATQLSFDTNAADCISPDAEKRTGKRALRTMHSVKASGDSHGGSPGNDGVKTAAIAFAGLLLAGALGRSSRKLRGLACLIVLGTIGLALSACGGSSSTTISDPPKGTYTVTVTGNDTTTALSASTSFTFTIQ